MAAAAESKVRAHRRSFDGRFGGRDMALEFSNRLLDAGVLLERIQFSESSVCDGTPTSDTARVTVWYFHHEEVR